MDVYLRLAPVRNERRSNRVTGSVDKVTKAARNKAWRAANKETLSARSAEYRAEHRQELRDKARVWRESPENRDKVKVYHRMYHYGLSNEAYEAMRLGQGGKCAACGLEEKLVVDHDHETGAVRSLLCQPCNMSLGALGEDPERMLKLVSYVNRWK